MIPNVWFIDNLMGYNDGVLCYSAKLVEYNCQGELYIYYKLRNNGELEELTDRIPYDILEQYNKNKPSMVRRI